jgi:hypothetical protein
MHRLRSTIARTTSDVAHAVPAVWLVLNENEPGYCPVIEHE